MLCAAMLLAPAARAGPVELRADPDVASAGYYQLSWSADGPVVVQEARSSGFDSPRVIYSGTDKARVVSGKPDGEWYYRARTADSGSPFGDAVRVTVRHHPFERALAFFAVGMLVFLATLLVIIKGARGA